MAQTIPSALANDRESSVKTMHEFNFILREVVENIFGFDEERRLCQLVSQLLNTLAGPVLEIYAPGVANLNLDRIAVAFAAHRDLVVKLIDHHVEVDVRT